MEVNFTKMHGLGNDFIVLKDPPTLNPTKIKSLAHRQTGIGFDQALVIEEPRRPDTDFYYRIFNADGSEVEQCGNGARCLAYWQSIRTQRFGHLWRMDSPAGIIEGISQADGQTRVAMGVPVFEPARVPFIADTPSDSYKVDVGDDTVHLSIASMGNPHGVLLVDDVAHAPVEKLGPKLESHARFPKRANIGFMQIISRQHIKLRVFERGVGETQACGTGACAAVAVGRRLGLLDETVGVDLPGGQVSVRWPGDDAVLWLSGEAVYVYTGHWRA